MRPQRLGVLGLGAIGGSVARQATRAGVPEVVGFDTSSEEVASAVEAGAVARAAASPEEVIHECDLAVLAAPPMSNLALLGTLSDSIRDGSVVVTDVSGVKDPIVQRARELGLASQFAGSHPFCGTHLSGFEAAREDLFHDAVVYVTPVGDDLAVTDRIVGFWRDVLGACPVVVAAPEHDDMLALTSHLPQAVGSALAVALAEHAKEGAVFGAGARDTTRLAAGSTAMWRDIMMLNRSPILQSLDAFERSVEQLKRAVSEGDASAIEKWFDRGAEFRRRMPE